MLLAVLTVCKVLEEIENFPFMCYLVNVMHAASGSLIILFEMFIDIGDIENNTDKAGDETIFRGAG